MMDADIGDTQMLTDKLNRNEAVVCVVGLGYVGLPLAIEFSKSLRVIGYEIDEDKIKRLNNSELNRENTNLFITNDPAKIRDADFVIISVPTPVTRSQEPDLGYVESAAETISQNLKQGSVVILESTVYPGVTEEIVKPILERSGLRCGRDFKVAYSPERLNPNFLRKNLVKPSDIPLRSSQIIARGMVQIHCRYGDVDTSAKNPVSHGFGVLGLFMGLMLNWFRGCGWWRGRVVDGGMGYCWFQISERYS
jgi:hypothetical protein